MNTFIYAVSLPKLANKEHIVDLITQQEHYPTIPLGIYSVKWWNIFCIKTLISQCANQHFILINSIFEEKKKKKKETKPKKN